jgi:hypothetical protein
MLHMEKYEKPQLFPREKLSQRPDYADPASTLVREGQDREERLVHAKESVLRYTRKFQQKARRRKWLGIGLSALGLAATMMAFPFYAFSLIGAEFLLVPLAVLIVGGILIVTRPRRRDVNQALAVALSYGNELSVTRLALELDISFQRAERIIQQLVENGVAEIDLDHKDPDGSVVYKIKGL